MSSPVIAPPEFKRPLSSMDRLFRSLSDSQINAISGAVAGVGSALAVCPLDVAKTKLQAQGGILSLQRHYSDISTPPSATSAVLRATHAAASAVSSSSPPAPHQSSPLSAPSPIAQRVAPLSSPLPATAPSARARDFHIPYQGKYRGVLGTLSTIYREEGIPGLYRGVVPITIGYLPTWAIYFVVYEDVKKLTAASSLADYPFFSHMISALSAGSSSTLATNPIWVVKTRLMTQSPGHTKYKGTIDAFHKMFVEEGVLSFYAGLGPALLGLLHVAVHFPLYEELKKLFHVDENVPKLQQSPQIVTASVISKICASSITYPHEVIRTRIQIQPTIIESITSASPTSQNPGRAPAAPPQPSASSAPSTPQDTTFLKKRNTSLMKYHGIIQTTKTIWREEGWRAFYSGLGMNMIRTVPASALTLLTYEIVASYLKDQRKSYQ